MIEKNIIFSNNNVFYLIQFIIAILFYEPFFLLHALVAINVAKIPKFVTMYVDTRAVHSSTRLSGIIGDKTNKTSPMTLIREIIAINLI